MGAWGLDHMQSLQCLQCLPRGTASAGCLQGCDGTCCLQELQECDIRDCYCCCCCCYCCALLATEQQQHERRPAAKAPLMATPTSSISRSVINPVRQAVVYTQPTMVVSQVLLVTLLANTMVHRIQDEEYQAANLLRHCQPNDRAQSGAHGGWGTLLPIAWPIGSVSQLGLPF